MALFYQHPINSSYSLKNERDVDLFLRLGNLTRFRAFYWAWLDRLKELKINHIYNNSPSNCRTKLNYVVQGIIQDSDVYDGANPDIQELVKVPGVDVVSLSGWKCRESQGTVLRLKFRSMVAYPIPGFKYPESIMTINEGLCLPSCGVLTTVGKYGKIISPSPSSITLRSLIGSDKYDYGILVKNPIPHLSTTIVVQWTGYTPTVDEVNQAINQGLSILLDRTRKACAWTRDRQDDFFNSVIRKVCCQTGDVHRKRALVANIINDDVPAVQRMVARLLVREMIIKEA